HLQSKAGRWNGSSWITDSVSSPCIDAGYSSSSFSNEPQNNGGRINIGVYGNTREASLSGTSPQSEMPGNPGSGSSPFEETSPISPTNPTPPADTPVSTPPVLTIKGGSGSGAYTRGQAVSITADTPVQGRVFDKWIGDTAYLSDVTSATALVTVPDQSVSLIATYKKIPITSRILNPLQTDSFTGLVTNFLQWLLSIAGGLGFLIIIIGGIVYITSSGDEQKAALGKKIVTGALLGLIVVLISYSIIVEIEKIFVD
ncbi:MAG: hypothetical protein PHX30_05315, partial [Candidatus Pacebacteria bacterium]|nr:hypothetical protein [Candidatus Paceibacterota bacterium]